LSFIEHPSDIGQSDEMAESKSNVKVVFGAMTLGREGSTPLLCVLGT